MAHRILGVELGAFSVKVVIAQAGFRSVTVTDYAELPVPPASEEDPSSPLERAARVLGEYVRRRGLLHDVPCAALPGDELSIRVIDFGFSGVKRADLDRAVGSELEGQLPHDLEELVYDFETIPLDAEGEGEGGAGTGGSGKASGPDMAPGSAEAMGGASGPGRGGGGPPERSGTRVLAAATTRERVTRFLSAMAREGVEPRSVLAAPTLYARVVEKLAAAGGPEARHDPVLVIDCGHSRTNVAVVKNGKTIFARTLSRGGRHVTLAIARAWNLPYDQAEQAKHSDGFVASSREPAPSEAWARVSHVIQHELLPLVRDLRQTLAACRAATGVSPRRAVLCGGGGRLRGLSSFLAEQIDLPVGVVTADDAPRLVGEAAAARGMVGDSALLAHGACLEGATGRPLFDLRKGDLAYKADFTFLRAKAGYFAACALVLGALLAGNAYAALYKLRTEERILDERLRAETTAIFGAPISAGEVQEKMNPKKDASPLPKLTAFDQLVEISKRLPARDKARLDVLELDIKPQKITMKATTNSASSIDEIEKALLEHECFVEVQRGRVQSGTADEKQFTLTIVTKCE